VGGFFQSGQDVNYITLSLESAEQGLAVVFHEFSHLLLRNVFADAPLWFNEGLAEYYSTFAVPSRRRADIGKPVEHHVKLLQSRTLPFARFFAVDRNSPEYTRDSVDRMLLYAQAWAIVHHAFHGESNRRDQLLSFVTKLADGGQTEESFRSAYGIEVRDLEKEVQLYVKQLSFHYTQFQFREDLVTRLETKGVPISDAAADAWLGDLLSHMQRDEEATVRLQKALAADKDLALAHSSLGALQIRGGKTAEGMRHLKEAQALGTANENVYFLYAFGLVSEADADGLQQASQALQRAIALRPGYTEAKLLLGYVYVSSGDYTAARDLLIPVVRAEPTNHRAALRLGEALLALGDIEGARKVLGPVIARTTDESEKQHARTLLARSTESGTRREAPASPGSNRVIPIFRRLEEGERRDTGVFEAVECGPKGVVFVVRTAESRLRTRAARFEDVEFLTYRALASQSISCGAQVPAMDVYLTWRPPAGSNANAEGTTVAIEILPEP
jgi:tetratricopeptide (TPR) repeat protein